MSGMSGVVPFETLGYVKHGGYDPYPTHPGMPVMSGTPGYGTIHSARTLTTFGIDVTCTVQRSATPI